MSAIKIEIGKVYKITSVHIKDVVDTVFLVKVKDDVDKRRVESYQRNSHRTKVELSDEKI